MAYNCGQTSPSDCHCCHFVYLISISWWLFVDKATRLDKNTGFVKKEQAHLQHPGSRQCWQEDLHCPAGAKPRTVTDWAGRSCCKWHRGRERRGSGSGAGGGQDPWHCLMPHPIPSPKPFTLNMGLLKLVPVISLIQTRVTPLGRLGLRHGVKEHMFPNQGEGYQWQ